MLILGIESTCDETACAIVRDGREILANVVASQTDLHSVYGGVIPELACRRHVDVMLPVIQEALTESGVGREEIDKIAVAHRPGLIGSVLIGVQAAKTLALAWNKPLLLIDHVEAHLIAPLITQEATFPAVGVVLSGGHTSLYQLDKVGSRTLLGQTHDDAIGEAFDKVAKLLGLPYPGGPHVERLAKKGDSERYPFNVGQIKTNPLAFSFSGVKTAVLYATQKASTEQDKWDIAASFQQRAFADVIKKTVKACKHVETKTVLFGGGVTDSQTLRRTFAEKCPDLELFWPAPGLSLDNAAMIASAGFFLD